MYKKYVISKCRKSDVFFLAKHSVQDICFFCTFVGAISWFSCSPVLLVFIPLLLSKSSLLAENSNTFWIKIRQLLFRKNVCPIPWMVKVLPKNWFSNRGRMALAKRGDFETLGAKTSRSFFIAEINYFFQSWCTNASEHFLLRYFLSLHKSVFRPVMSSFGHINTVIKRWLKFLIANYISLEDEGI